MASPIAPVRRLLGEPLIQFLLIGGGLFALWYFIHGAGPPPKDVIVIPQGRVMQLEEGFKAVSGRAPGPEELASLVDDFVMEEIGYREALAMGLDADDTVVRRRMRQKIEFLLDDVAAIEEPTEAQLQSWFKDHLAAYSTDARKALRQVLISRDVHGEGIRKDADAVLKQLRAGADPEELGDDSMLPATAPLTSKVGVAALFGDAFADTVFAHKGEDWFGPVESVYGLHLVQLTDSADPIAPDFDTVREQVHADFLDARRKEVRAKAEERMRERYQVHVDWPKGRDPSKMSTSGTQGIKER